MKPSALFLLNPDMMDLIYDETARARIEQTCAMIAPPQSAEQYRQLGTKLQEVEVIFSGWSMPEMTPEFLELFPKLKMLFYGAGSVRNIVTETSWARGVRVVSAGRANAVPTSEYAFANIILCLKQVWMQANQISRNARYERSIQHVAGAYGSTVGLLGLGQIGRLVAQRLSTLDVRVIASDPMVSAEDATAMGVTLTSLEEVFAQSDVVSCHIPWVPVTERILKGAHFRAMKPHASFINSARGAVVAEDEMIEVLTERPDLFALLDVTHPEPPVEGSPLFTLPNVVLTPHIAGSAGGECHRMGKLIADEVERYIRGETLEHEITAAQAATMA